MKAKINTYEPQTGYCSIFLGYKTYELEGIGQVIEDHYKYKTTPIPVDPFLDSIFAASNQRIISKMERILKESTDVKKDLQSLYDEAITPIAIA